MKDTIYKKAAAVVLCLSFVASAAACDNTGTPDMSANTETSASTTETSETTTTASSESSEDTPETSIDSSNPYSMFIEDYRQAVSEPVDTWYYGPGIDYDGEFPPEGTVGLITQGLSDNLLYTLYDIDGNGVDELLIGGPNGTQVDITGVVTMDGDEYKILLAGWSRASVLYLGEGYFYTAGSGGAVNHVACIYEYNGNNRCMDLICQLYSENEMNDDAVYEYREGTGGRSFTDVIYTGEEASEAFESEYNEVADSTNELLDAEWMPLF